MKRKTVYNVYDLQNNAKQMRSFSIIEDLDSEQYQDLLHKNPQDILTDSLIRNFTLIKKYAYSDNQLFITKFKKKLIPQYLQQLQQYSQSQLIKNRQLYYARRKNSTDNILCRKNRQSLPELNKTSFLNQLNLAHTEESLNPVSYHKSFPILFNQKPTSKKHPSYQNLSKIHIEEASPSETLICGPMFLISSKKKIIQLQKISKENLSKSYANIYSESIKFCHNILFKNTFDQIGSKRQSRQSTEGLSEIFNVKRTLADEKSIQKKMMNVLKKRKSSKTLKMKIFSGYINTKKSTFDQKSSIDPKDKQNIHKISFNQLNKQPTQTLLKQKMMKFGLKGKLCIPMKNHRMTTSTVSDQPKFPRQTIQILDQIIDLPSINNRNNILGTTLSKFTLPKFS